MIYMVADNDLEKRAFEDLKEIESTGGSNANVNFVVEVDGKSILTQATLDAQNQVVPIESTRGKAFRFQVGGAADPRFISMRTHGYNALIGEKDMGTSTELAGFIAWAKATYPAQKYALILWDHGRSWKSFGVDLTTVATSAHDFLHMGELRTALNGQTFELIGFDACMMASIEVAHQIQPFAKYMVASEDQIETTGWPYDLWAGDLRTTPAMDGAALGRKLVEKFCAFYQCAQNSGPTPRDPIATISSVNLANVPALVAAVSAFAADLKAGVDDFISHDTPADNVQEQIHTVRLNTTQFTDPNFMDLGHFARLIDASAIPISPNQCYKVHLPPVIAQTVVPGPVIDANGNGSSRRSAMGLSIHMPLLRTNNRDGSSTAPCEGDTDTYDCPSDSRETDRASRRAAYAPNVDCLPFLAVEVEGKTPALAAPAEWTMVPSPNLRFVVDTQWDEFLQRYYHPVADNRIIKAICPDGREIEPVIVDPQCGNPIDEITIIPGCEVFFRATGSSDADTNNPALKHHMWDFDHATSGCGACIAPYEVGTGVPAHSADDDMNAEHDCSKAPLTDEKQADATAASRVYTDIRDYLVTLHAWDDNHTFKRHDTNPGDDKEPGDDYVHPQTDDHTSIVHVCSQGSTPGSIQGVGVQPGSNNNISWKTLAVATSYDVVTGDLRNLSLSGGNFTTSLTGCLENDGVDLHATDPSIPPLPGSGIFYIVRGTNGVGQPGTYDSGVPGQVGSRDAEIHASPASCP